MPMFPLLCKIQRTSIMIFICNKRAVFGEQLELRLHKATRLRVTLRRSFQID